MARSNGAHLTSGRAFFKGSSGKWAGERMVAAMKAGKQLNAGVLRTNDTLRHEEWKYFDQQLLAEALIQLRGVARLQALGLTINVPNSMGKTVFAYEKVTDMDEASVSMDPVTRSENDRQEFDMSNLPLPITHKDFYINLRTLMASRERGEPLDATQIRTAGRKVSERAEKMLYQGGPTFGTLPIYGFTTALGRHTTGYGTNGNWDAANVAKTGNNILDDLIAMMALAAASRYYGPFTLHVPRNANNKLDNDFKALSDITIRQRLLEVDGLSAIICSDQLPTNNVILSQDTLDVAAWINGETLQTVQWDVEGGFHINFKAFQIGVPLLRTDIQGRSGIVHMS